MAFPRSLISYHNYLETEIFPRSIVDYRSGAVGRIPGRMGGVATREADFLSRTIHTRALTRERRKRVPEREARKPLARNLREPLPELADMAEAIPRPIRETGDPRLNVEIRGKTPARPEEKRIRVESFLPLKQGARPLHYII